MATEKKIEPTKENTAIDTSKWPLLLKNYDQLKKNVIKKSFGLLAS